MMDVASRGQVRGTVLVVDDDEDLREAIELTLVAKGHEVATAADGGEALAWMRREPARPCVVLLDLMMPGMNGFELRAHMNADPGLSRIPVVIITGAPVLTEERESELGAEILRKPIAMSALIDVVDRFCCRADA